MSFMKGNLLTKTRKLVKGLARSEPVWLKAMELAPQATFPRADSKVKVISLPEDVYIKKFFGKYPDSKHEDAFRFSDCEAPPARIFGWRVLELREHGVTVEQAIAVADMEYRTERKGRKKAYFRLKEIAPLQGKRPPPNPYPCPVKEIQAEEKKYINERFHDPEVRKILENLKAERYASMERPSMGDW